MTYRGNRKDPDHVAQWRTKYRVAMNAYVTGLMNMKQAHDVLEDLGYKSEALRIELRIWDLAREGERRRQGLP